MVMCDLYYNDPYRQSYCKQEPTSLEHNDVLMDMIVGKVYGFTVTKLLRRSLYQQYDLQYPVGMYGCEDQYTMCKLLKNDIRIVYLPNAYYHYMHYGNSTQSRRYDENTYLHDVKIRDMFVELLADTPYKQLAYDKKTDAVFSRAFYFGYDMYSSKTFHERFGEYKLRTSDKSMMMKVLYKSSQKGFYHVARGVWGLMFNAKQFLKSLHK